MKKKEKTEANEQIKENEKMKLKKELYIKILILLILILLLIITTFNTGRKFYLLKNTFFDTSKGEVYTGVARWNFDAKIIINEKVVQNE